MDDSNGIIYGLELQARALAPQLGDNHDVRFFVATNSIKPMNQVHLLEYNDEKGTIQSKIFEHALGEVWKLTSSPHDANLISTCYSSHKNSQVLTEAALLRFADDLNDQPMKNEFFSWEQIEELQTSKFGEKVKTIEFHPSQKQTLACVVNGHIVIFDRTESQTREAANVSVAGSGSKTANTFTTGKWSSHHQGNQFIALIDTNVRSYDIRDTQHCAWGINDAHAQLVRDIDCNPNKHSQLVTAGDDGYVRLWDCRKVTQPLFERNDHAHWVWAVRFNTFHDQLILSSSSDCKIMLTCVGSLSSEATNLPVNESTEVQHESGTTESQRYRILPDGLLQTFDQHEDSVYCVEWSCVDPWIFASLSYDGRVLISKVPKHFKYQIIF